MGGQGVRSGTKGVGVEEVLGEGKIIWVGKWIINDAQVVGEMLSVGCLTVF